MILFKFNSNYLYGVYRLLEVSAEHRLRTANTENSQQQNLNLKLLYQVLKMSSLSKKMG